MYCIDYRNGGMGNTILAHILYACNQTDFDLETFFNSNGNAHNILKYNNSKLIAKHLCEFPDNNVTCILEVYCKDWSELLRIKLSYSKWTGENPTKDNYHKHNFNFKIKDQSIEELWKDFYLKIKDPSWPQCNKIENVKYLPDFIQKEINETWKEPRLGNPTTDLEFVELLTKTYYDEFCSNKRMFEKVPGILLDNYLDGDFSELKNLSNTVLNWEWNNYRSRIFFKKTIEANQKYLDWLENIKFAVSILLDKRDIKMEFDLWEQAIIIAKTCNIVNFDPVNIKWQNKDCTANIKNVYLTKFKKELSWQNLST